jgi:hypothetical protein
MDMRSLFVAVSTVLLASGISATGASAHARCDGDFELINGSWSATRACQEHEAEKVSREMHMHISEHPSGRNEWSAEEFCRGNPDIRVSTFCASYKD